MPPAADDSRELRERMLRNSWRLDALDEWRRNVVDPSLQSLHLKMDDLAKRDEVESAVRNAAQSNRTLRLSTWQRLGAILYGLAIAYASLGGPH